MFAHCDKVMLPACCCDAHLCQFHLYLFFLYLFSFQLFVISFYVNLVCIIIVITLIGFIIDCVLHVFKILLFNYYYPQTEDFVYTFNCYHRLIARLVI